jgi:hypothetical protein
VGVRGVVGAHGLVADRLAARPTQMAMAKVGTRVQGRTGPRSIALDWEGGTKATSVEGKVSLRAAQTMAASEGRMRPSSTGSVYRHVSDDKL